MRCDGDDGRRLVVVPYLARYWGTDSQAAGGGDIRGGALMSVRRHARQRPGGAAAVVAAALAAVMARAHWVGGVRIVGEDSGNVRINHF